MAGSKTISNSTTKIEAMRFQSSTLGAVLPKVYGQTRISGNLVWYGGFTPVAHTTTQRAGKGGGTKVQNTTYTYTAHVLMALGEGPIYSVPTVWRGKKVDAPGNMGLGVFTGALGQAAWSAIASVNPAQSIGYSGMALAYGYAYDLGESAQVENHSFEVQSALAYSVSGTTPDCDLSDAIKDALTDTRYGAGFPAAKLDFASWSNYCRAAGLLMSPALTEQQSAAALVDLASRLTVAAPVWSGGVLKVIPYGDQTLTGNFTTYTPNVTPRYDLTDDHFLPGDSGGDPIVVSVRDQSDAKNAIKVEFLDRANGYNVAIAEAKDQADIDTTGLRAAEVVSARWICDAAVARTVAQLLLQRSLYVRTTYAFKLPWSFALLEPMDWVTLTDPALGLNLTPVRILSVEEGEDGELAIEAEEVPAGVATATQYPTQSGVGFSHNYNTSPGSVATPTFFELPVERTTTGLEVAVAVRGAGASWGGCRVWMSLDGTNYREAGVIWGGAAYGTLSGAIAGGNLPVALVGGTINAASAADAAALTSLAYIGGASPEYLAYQGASLTAANAYTLSGLVRGAYGTNGAVAHAAGDAFVLMDSRIARTGGLDLGLIGKTISFKFTSFNVYGGGEESLANVAAYPYTVAGTMAQLPPASAVTGLAATIESYGIGIKWAKHPEADVTEYEVRVGAAFASATQVERAGGTSSRLPVRSAGSYTLWVAPVDRFGNLGPATSTTLVIAAPAVAAVNASVVQGKLRLAWTPGAASFPIVGYRLSWGAAVGANAIGDVTATVWDADVRYAGARTYWVQAMDAAGNLGPGASVPVQIDAPTLPQSPRADVVDNNVLLYWSVPAGGSLPVERYEVRKGASWAAGTPVGSNGNSTFTAIFESAGGVYTYWIAAVDTAGTIGQAASIAATVSQPPDYVLRSNLDLSSWSGTLSNAVKADGALWAPVAAETWQQHFANRAWTSPQDQINAGNPLYIEPAVASGYYEETIDYGAVLPATTITVTPTATVIAGSVTLTPTISWKVNAGDAWTSAAAGQSAVLAASGFRYVKVRYDFTCAGGANVVRVDRINVKLAVKLRTDSGAGTANAADVGGTPINFNVTFVDADLPLVQPGGLTAVIPVVDFTDQPYPTGFKVLLYDRNGNRVSGPFSWTARGY